LPEPDTNTHADNSDTNTDANNSDSDANSDAGDTDTYPNGDNHTTTAFADTDTKRDSAAADTKATANAVPSAYAVSDRVEELQELKSNQELARQLASSLLLQGVAQLEGGSARVSSATGRIRRGERVGGGVSPSRTSLALIIQHRIANVLRKLFRRDAGSPSRTGISMRDVCATQSTWRAAFPGDP
jgi:hypothetical protein